MGESLRSQSPRHRMQWAKMSLSPEPAATGGESFPLTPTPPTQAMAKKRLSLFASQSSRSAIRVLVILEQSMSKVANASWTTR